MKTCKQCGKELPLNTKRKFCGDECSTEHWRAYQKMYRETHKKKAPVSSLAEVSKQAREHGMSYGEYMTYLKRRNT